MGAADRRGHPLAAHATSASPDDVSLVKQPVDASLVAVTADRRIGDAAYDSDAFDEHSASRVAKWSRFTAETQKYQSGAHSLHRYKNVYVSLFRCGPILRPLGFADILVKLIWCGHGSKN
jgi:hypothetical protein